MKTQDTTITAKIMKMLKKLFRGTPDEEAISMSKVMKIENKLLSLCKQDKSFVATINGSWGVGKTHFWNDFVEKNLTLQENTIPYVSLFGKESIKDILTSIMIQISKHAKWAEEAREVMGTSNFQGIDFVSMFSIGKPRDFKDIIVCFDDFERISNKLDINDVLGLISDLKEQKNCKVIMILNQEELGENAEKCLTKYKDKIINYEFKYEPTPEESYELVKEELKHFERYLLDYIKEKNIVNIRVLKRLIDALNDFSFICEHVTAGSFIEKEIVDNIIEISTINSINMSIDFQELSKYSVYKIINGTDDGFKEKPEYDKLLKYIDMPQGHFEISDITDNIIEYTKNSFVEQEKLIEIIKQRKKQDITNSIKQLYISSKYTMQYTSKAFATDLYKILKHNQDNLENMMTESSFMFNMNKLKKLDSSRESEYHTFAVKVLKRYLLNHLKSDEHHDLFEQGRVDEIEKYDITLQEYADNYRNKNKKSQVDSVEKVIKLLHKPIKNSGWGEEPKLLALIPKEKCKEYILENPEYLKATISLIQYISRSSHQTEFEIFVNNNTQVLEELKNDGNEDHKIKAIILLDDIKK